MQNGKERCLRFWHKLFAFSLTPTLSGRGRRGEHTRLACGFRRLAGIIQRQLNERALGGAPKAAREGACAPHFPFRGVSKIISSGSGERDGQRRHRATEGIGDGAEQLGFLGLQVTVGRDGGSGGFDELALQVDGHSGELA